MTFSHSSCGERRYTAWGRERSADTAQVKHETSCHLGGIVPSWLWNNSHRSVPFMLPYGSSKPTAELPRHIAPLMPLTAVIIFQHFFFCSQKANLMPGSAATQSNTVSGLCQRQTGHAPTWRSPLLALQLPDRRGHWWADCHTTEGVTVAARCR